LNLPLTTKWLRELAGFLLDPEWLMRCPTYWLAQSSSLSANPVQV
jgi:hypothetical protein